MFQGIILLFECLIKYATRTVEVQSRLLWITMLFVLTIANDAPVCVSSRSRQAYNLGLHESTKDPVRGSLRKWNMKDQVVVISNEQGIVEIPFVEVLWLTPVGESEEWQTDHEGGWMILSNGDQFPFQLPIADEVTLVARTQRLGKIEIPLEMVRAMLLKRTRNEESRFRLIHRLSRLQNKEDVLLMSSGDSYAGTFLGISSNHYRFEVAGSQVELDRAEVPLAKNESGVTGYAAVFWSTCGCIVAGWVSLKFGTRTDSRRNLERQNSISEKRSICVK